MNTFVTSCMWNIDATRPTTIAGPIANNAGSANRSTAFDENLADPTVCTNPNTMKAPTHICDTTVNTIIGNSPRFMIRSPSDSQWHPYPGQPAGHPDAA